jgi:dienelactone hydrolase
VIGHRFNNAQLIADQFAANGYFVLMPDLFDKDPVPLNRTGDFDIMKWLTGEYHPTKKAHLPPVVDPIIDACLIEMRTKYNVKVRQPCAEDERQRHISSPRETKVKTDALQPRNSAP